MILQFIFSGVGKREGVVGLISVLHSVSWMLTLFCSLVPCAVAIFLLFLATFCYFLLPLDWLIYCSTKFEIPGEVRLTGGERHRVLDYCKWSFLHLFNFLCNLICQAYMHYLCAIFALCKHNLHIIYILFIHYLHIIYTLLCKSLYYVYYNISHPITYT